MGKTRHMNFAATMKGEKTWREYRRTHGTISSDGWLITAIIGTLVVAFIWLKVQYWHFASDNIATLTRYFFYGSVVTTAIGYIGFLYINIRYFKRNVIGYELWLYHEKSCDETLHEVQHAKLVLRGEPMSVEHSAVIISLGGWFTRKVRINRVAEYGRGWNIDSYFLKNCEDNDIPSRSEVLIKTHDEAMRVGVNTLIGFMDHVIKESTCRPAWPYNFGDALMRYYSMAVNDGRDLEFCLNALHSVADRILDTKRFGKSKEAAGIRADILNILKQVLPPGDYRLPRDDSSSSAA